MDGHILNSFSVPGTVLCPRGVQRREASLLPFRGFWVMKGEKVPRWTRERRTFQVEGKRQGNRQFCAVKDGECFHLARGPWATVEVKAEESGKTNRFKENLELRNLTALVGNGEPVKNFKRETLRIKFAFWEQCTDIEEENGSGIGSGDGRKNGDCWSVGSYFCKLEAEAIFLLVGKWEMLHS